MIRIHFLAQQPTDIVIRDGKTYVSVAPVTNALWVAHYEEIEVLRGKDYDSARSAERGHSGRYSGRSSDDPYRFTRGGNPFDSREFRERFSEPINREAFYSHIFGRDDGIRIDPT